MNDKKEIKGKFKEIEKTEDDENDSEVRRKGFREIIWIERGDSPFQLNRIH